MKKKELEQIENIVGRVVKKETAGLKQDVGGLKKSVAEVKDDLQLLTKLTKDNFDQSEKRFDKIEGKVDKLDQKFDDYGHDVAVIEKQQEAETKTLDNHEERIEILEKVH